MFLYIGKGNLDFRYSEVLRRIYLYVEINLPKIHIRTYNKENELESITSVVHWDKMFIPELRHRVVCSPDSNRSLLAK